MQMKREQFNLLNVNTERNAYNENPDYQRESAVWSIEKRQLLIDSILNDYDIPKLYLHDFTPAYNARRSIHKYAIVDGKQRLSAIWAFLGDEYPLDTSFSFSAGRSPGDTTQDIAGKRFSEFDSNWHHYLLGKKLDVVLIDTDDLEEIEDLFMRLNNGEPLNAAEKRNAVGGEMCRLVRKVGQHRFFTRCVPFENRRYAHYEASAKVLLVEHSLASSGSLFVDLKKKFLDKLVRDNLALAASTSASLEATANEQLRQMALVFSEDDPLLSKQAYIPMYYLFNRELKRKYRGRALNAKMKRFLDQFAVRRKEDLEREEELRDPYLSEFGRRVQQGTNDRTSLEWRVQTLISYFLADYPDSVYPIDAARAFDEEERAAIWIRADRKCQVCGRELPLLEMHADHRQPWIDGGKTALKNARCLCVICNTGGGGPAPAPPSTAP